MNTLASSIICIALRIGIATALALSVVPVSAHPAHAQAQPTPSRTMNGYDVSGRFLEVWSKQGTERDSLYVNGLPITAKRQEISLDDGKLYDTQWFERARYEMHPSNKVPNDVLLGRLGWSRVEGRGKIDSYTGKVASPADAAFVGVDKPADLSASKLWFPETRHTLTGDFLKTWQQYGGLAQFGFPLSEPHQETSQADDKQYLVQYFERNRMELHPDKPAPYNVELGLLGVEQVGMRAVPGDELPVAPTKGVASANDTITIGMRFDPATLDMFTTSETTLRIRSLIEDGLTGRDDNGNLFPLDAWYVPTIENGGAQFIGVGEDRYLRVKYRIRQGVKWNDGVELTSNDAMFAYRLFTQPDAPIANWAEFWKLQNVDNPSKYTIIYNYKSSRQAADLVKSVPNPQDYSFLQPFIAQKKPVISRLYSEVGAIYPEHVLGKIPVGNIRDSLVSSAPVGTGPYKVAQWNKRQDITLVPNQYYNLTAPPPIKKIVIKFISDTSSLIPGQTKTGSLDMLTSDVFTTQPPLDKEGIELAGYKLASRPGATWEHLDFYSYYPPFQDRAVREAIITGINRQRIIDTVYKGMGSVPNGPAPSGLYYSLDHPDFARNYPAIAAKYKLPTYAYDPERAKRLLEDAGWKVGPDGIRAKAGVKLSFTYGAVVTSIRTQIQTLVSADLKAIGIEARQQSYPSPYACWECYEPDFWTFWRSGEIKLSESASIGTRDGDFGEWVCERLPDPGIDPGRQTDIRLENAFRFCDTRAREANNQFKTEADLNAQLEAAAQIQTLLMQNVALVPLVQRPNIEVVRATLANYKLPNTSTNSFWNARQWYFK